MTRRERTKALRSALDEMGRDDRQVLMLTLVEGLKSGEIADRLGLSPDVVRTRKARAIKRLTERLKAG
jgi:RNA polymerase sigma factor (sigma-70 family)